MKTLYLSIILLVLSFTSLYCQQEINSSIQNGLLTHQFQSLHGTVTVYIPMEFKSGSRISGSIINEEKAINNKKNKKTIVKLFGETIDVETGIFELILTEKQMGNSTIEFIDHTKHSLVVPLEKLDFTNVVSELNECVLPDYLVSGETNCLIGKFDGVANNTSLYIENQAFPIIAESPHFSYYQVPENIHGKHNLNIKEDDFEVQVPIEIISYELKADQLNLHKGQNTQLHFIIHRINPEMLPIFIEVLNETPLQIDLNGNNHHHIEILEQEINEGTYIKTFDIKAISDGNFDVLGTLIDNRFPLSQMNIEDFEINDEENEVIEIKPEYCGRTWHTEWKVISKTRKLDESGKKLEGRTNRSKCPTCKEYTNYTYYLIPEYEYRIEEREVYTCKMPKGHANYPQSCHGTPNNKERREVRTGQVLRYRVRKVGYCGHSVDSGWRNP